MASGLSPRLLLGFGAVLVVIGVLGGLALSLMGDLSARAERVATENIPELLVTGKIRTALQEYRQLQLRLIVESSEGRREGTRADLIRAEVDIAALFAEFDRTVAEDDERATGAELRVAWEAYVARTGPSAGAPGRGATAVAAITGPARVAFDGIDARLRALQLDEEAQAVATHDAGQDEYRAAQITFASAVAGGILGIGGLGLWLLVVRPLRRAGADQAFRRRFQDALEMADDEDEALSTLARSLDAAHPGVPSELLLADSSQAHLHRAVLAGPDPAGPGCPVDAPHGCAAVRRGQTTVFGSSEEVGACPKLRGRPAGACSAICTPVTVLGRTIGVLHATGPVDHPPAGSTRDALESAAGQIGSRLGVIRAMAQSQLQASTDPLTGLLNRRSLEDRVQDLRRARVPFAVAMVDLDHFKRLNDSFGHETGDRALRLFARTAAETVRVQDIVARHGGEEFVIVFPRCSGREAAEVLERVRAGLRAALDGAELPGFTCSAGVAEAGPQEAFHDALRAADEALMSAKSSGRDRILIASPIRSGAATGTV